MDLTNWIHLSSETLESRVMCRRKDQQAKEAPPSGVIMKVCVYKMRKLKLVGEYHLKITYFQNIDCSSNSISRNI